MRRSRILIAIAAFAGGLVIGLVMIREPMGPLTIDLLTAAKERWCAADVRDYAIRYRLNADVYEVTVENQLVTSATVNGQPPRTDNLRSYTVDGLFRVLEMELENLADPHGPFASQQGVILAKVRFNKKFGYIERYLRNSAGTGLSASIELLEFSRPP